MKSILKLPLAGFSFILFLVTLLLYLYFFTSVPEQRLNDWLQYSLKSKIGYRISVGSINRDIWKRFEIKDIVIYHQDEGDTLETEIGRVKRIAGAFSLKNLLASKFVFSSVEVNGVHLSLMPGTLPNLEKRPDEGEKNDRLINIPQLKVDIFNLTNIDAEFMRSGEIMTLEISELIGSFESGPETATLNIASLSAGYTEKGFDLISCAGSVTTVKDDIFLRSLHFKSQQSNITLSGKLLNLDDPDFDLEFKFEPLNLDDIKTLSGVNLVGEFYAEGNLTGDETGFSGKLDGDGHLYGRDIEEFSTGFAFSEKLLTLDNFSGMVFKAPMAGDGYINFGRAPEEYGFLGDIRELNLQNIGVDIYSSFSGNVDMLGRGFSESSFAMKMNTELTQTDIDLYNLRKARGEIEFDLSALTFKPGFEIEYKNTLSHIDGKLVYNGEIDLRGETRFDDLSDFKGQFFIGDLDGIGSASYNVIGPTTDFTIEGSFASDSCRLYGLSTDSLYFDMSLKSFISHRVGTVKGFWSGGDLYTIPVDDGRFDIVVSGDRVFLDEIYWQNENNEMRAVGSFDNGAVPPTLAIDTLEIRLWNDTVYCTEPVIVEVYDKEFEFQRLILKSRESEIQMVGTITYENEMQLYIDATNVEIGPITGYFITDKPIIGTMSGQFALNGDFDSPIIESILSIDSLAVNNIQLGRFHLDSFYDNRLLTIQNAQLISGNYRYDINGLLPLNLSFTSDEGFLPPDEMSVTLKAAGRDLPIFPVFVSTVEYVNGDFSIELQLNGTYGSPQVEGKFQMSDGEIKPIDLVDPIRQVSITGRMTNDMVYLDKIEGYVLSEHKNVGKKIFSRLNANQKTRAQKGLIRGTGTIKLLDLDLFEYDLNLIGKGCEFYTDSYDIQGETDMTIRVSGSSPPLISGRLNLIRLDMREPFSTFYATEATPDEVLEDSTIWDMRIEIVAPNNLWIKNNENVIEFEGSADMELEGDIVVVRENGIYKPLGELNVIRGDYYLGNKKFPIRNGQLIFNKPDTLDADIYFESTVNISDTRGSGITSEDATLDIVITGTLNQPKIGTAEGSGYSEEDLLVLLLPTLITGSESNTVTQQLLLQKLNDMFTSPIESTGIVDEININPYENTGNGENYGTSISFAKYLSPKLYLRYSRMLSQGADQTFGIEYFFNNNFSFEGRQRSSDHTNEEGIWLDMKFNYEF